MTTHSVTRTRRGTVRIKTYATVPIVLEVANTRSLREAVKEANSVFAQQVDCTDSDKNIGYIVHVGRPKLSIKGILDKFSFLAELNVKK